MTTRRLRGGDQVDPIDRKRGLVLPRVQTAIAEAFASAGVDLRRAAAVVAEVLDAPLSRTTTKCGDDENSVTTIEGVSAGDKLKAVDLFFRVTTGYAPTKSAALHANVPVDALFNPDEFAQTPPIVTNRDE